MLPNDWPMCRRIECSGLVIGEAGAVGTIGLLGNAPGSRRLRR